MLTITRFPVILLTPIIMFLLCYKIQMKYWRIFGTLNSHAKTTLKRVKTQLKPTWISQEINEARHKRDLFYKRSDMTNYSIWRNKVTQLIKESKIKILPKCNRGKRKVGDIWKCLCEFNPKHNHCTPNIQEKNGEISTSTIDIVKTVNDFS